MLSNTMAQAFNKQLNAEAYSGYLYMSMASYFESLGLRGFASWMANQAREEFFHTSKFYHFIIDRGGRVKLDAIEAPPAEWESVLEVYEYGLKHEGKVSSLINELVDLAKSESDHASDIFLQWFVSEQVEEESSFEEVVQQLKLVGNQGHGLFMMDKELGQRALGPDVLAFLNGTPPA